MEWELGILPSTRGVGPALDLGNRRPWRLVLRLMALGWETEHIAAELDVTLHTVRSHVANLRRKLNAKSRFEAVMTATRLGILSLGDR